MDDLLAHLNGVDENIRFTMEQEEGRCLPFLNVSVRREDDGSLRTGVFRKKRWTSLVKSRLSWLRMILQRSRSDVKQASVEALLIEVHL